MTGYMVVRTDAEKNPEFQQYLKESPNAKVTFDQMQYVRTQDSIGEAPGAPAAIEDAIREVVDRRQERQGRPGGAAAQADHPGAGGPPVAPLATRHPPLPPAGRSVAAARAAERAEQARPAGQAGRRAGQGGQGGPPVSDVAPLAYRVPPAPIAALIDAPELPDVALSPDRRWLLLLERPALPPIAELAEPELRLAGLRLNPRTNGPEPQQPLPLAGPPASARRERSGPGRRPAGGRPGRAPVRCAASRTGPGSPALAGHRTGPGSPSAW